MIDFHALSGARGPKSQGRERHMARFLAIYWAAIYVSAYAGFAWFLYELAVAWLRFDGVLR